MTLRLTDVDLRFLVETVADRRRDHDHLVDLVQDKEDFLEQMLEDTKLVERLLNDEEALVRVSPYMLFSILLRQVRRGLESKTYVLEFERPGRSLPVFQASAVADLLAAGQVLNYLTDLLCSFVKTNTGVIYWKERGTWHRRRFNDSDLDDMIALARLVDSELKPSYYKRVADIALFVSGIFPDQALRVSARPKHTLTTHRTLQDYEQEGQRFYALAAREPPEPGLQPVLSTLSEHFLLARTALNALSDQYLKPHRAHYFNLPAV